MEDIRLTPMMKQYQQAKSEIPGDAILLFRMGDFYEMFFDDAATASRVLDIALTKRGHHLGEDIPMCGVLVHSHEVYLQRLIRAGHRVAIAEQIEDPKAAKACHTFDDRVVFLGLHSTKEAACR